MTALPWHKRNHRDAIEGYMGLSLEERGAYTTILDLIYDRGGPLPDNERLIAGYLEISTRRYRAVRDALLAKGKLYRTDEGALFNARAASELGSLEKTQRTARECGANGGRKRVENEKKRNEIKAGEQAPLKPPSSYIDRDRDTVPKGTGGQPPIDLVKALFDEGVALLTAAGARAAGARSLIGKWRKQFGDGPALDAVREARDRAIAQPAEWIGPYLARRAVGANHGAGESLADLSARQERIDIETRQRIARLTEMSQSAAGADDLVAIMADRQARKGLIQ